MIKQFRVWDGIRFLWPSEFCLFSEDDGTFSPRRIGDFCLLHDIPNATTQQFTGLTDSAGRKIFEGDILEYSSTLYNSPKASVVIYTGVVEFSGLLCAYSLNVASDGRLHGENIQLFGDDQPQVYKVIGNIFETPELIK